MTAAVAVTFKVRERERTVLADALGCIAEPVYLTDLDTAGRAQALRDASAVLAHDTGRDLRPGEAAMMRSAHLLQFVSAGIDFVKLDDIPDGVPIAANGGAYAEPMAEH